MADDSDEPQTGQVLYSEEDEPATGTAAAKPDPGGPRSSSISTLSEASDPDADAEGEPDDLDADADGIEDDEAMDFSFGLPVRNGDEDGEDDESGGEEDDESDEEDGEDDSGEEMELDENASSPPPSPPSRLSEQPHQLDGEATKKPLVLKLKLASQPANVAAPAARPAKRKYVRKAPFSKSPAGRPRTTSNKKASTSARRRDTDEEDELADDALGSDNSAEDRPNQSGLYQAWDESDGGSSGDDATPTVGQLTVRQRAKEFGEQVTDLQSLPMTEAKKKKELTEADRAMEKAEKSRKRKHQNEKKLEDEKTETINRLLKGQIGKAGRSSGSKAAAALDATDDASTQVAQAARPPSPPPLPTMMRYVSSIRSGEYMVGLSVPSSVIEDYCRGVPRNPAPAGPYPPRVRPPPPTWKLVNGVRVN